MKRTSSILGATFWLAAACAPADSRSGPDEPSGGDSSSAGTSGATTSSGSDAVSETTSGETTVADADTSTGGTGAECVLPGVELLLECPEGLEPLGVPGARALESFAVDWEVFDENCGVSLTEPMYFSLPDDIVSVSVVVEADAGPIILSGATNDGVPLVALSEEGETGIGQPPFKHLPGSTANLTLPISPDTAPTPGCLALAALADGDISGEEGTVHVVTRRDDPAAATGGLIVNAVRVGDVEITAEEIDSALAGANALYETNAAGTLAEISFLDLPSDEGEYFPTEGPEIEALRSAETGGPTSSINVFFIEDFTDAAGVLGIAAGIPGPNGVPETAGSGVVIALASHRDLDGVPNTTLMGETIAHELGHQLGLFHTTEADGSDHDVVPDTPECTLDQDTNDDGQLAAEECPDGQNVMFWTSGSFSQDLMSPAQSDVVFFSPVSE